MQVRSWRHGGAFILYDEELLQAPTPELFDPGWWRAQNLTCGTHEGRGSVHVVRRGAARWVLRPYRRGGWAARVAESSYVWTGLERTRPWREWRLLAALHARGLPVPRPVAAHVSRHGLSYRGALLSEQIPDVRTLDEVLRERPLARDDWRRLGATLRRFHEAGVHHPDLNVRNILVQGNGGFHVLDFDRGHLGAGAPQIRRNLQRLRRSFDKLAAVAPECQVGAAEWNALLEGWQSP